MNQDRRAGARSQAAVAAENGHVNGTVEKAASVHLAVALQWLELGFSPVPPRDDGTKAPLPDVWDETAKKWTWSPYQEAPASRDHVEAWYRNGRTGNGVATGVGGLELFEFDDRETYERYKAAAEALGLGDLVKRIEAGYLEDTPGGGVHWFYVCDELRGNTKLAVRPAPTEENPRERKTLIETKGEGGFAVVAPSCGKVHPSGGAYRLLRGGPGLIQTITVGERQALWDLAETFNEIPPEPEKAPRRPRGATPHDVRPGDAYAAENSWDDILEPRGWIRVFTRGDVTYWRRPGKDEAWSATTGFCKGDDGSPLLYVFSTSTEFPDRKAVGKFHAYTIMHHGGDHAAAAKELAKRGYGQPRTSNGRTRAPSANGDSKRDQGGEAIQVRVEEQSSPPKRGDAHAGDIRPGVADGGKSYITNKHGVPRPCLFNTVLWIGTNKPDRFVRLNKFTRKIEVDGVATTDAAAIRITTEIEDHMGVPWALEHVHHALVHLGQQAAYNPLTDWLDSLRWDGVPRIGKFFADHFGAKEDQYTAEVGRVFFVSAVARAYEPGCKVDTVPILMGDQGLLKSSSVRALCPNPTWFADELGGEMGTKDGASGLGGKWLIELSELDAVRGKELKTVKSYIARQSDWYRSSYGRNHEDHPRSCVFFGTTNSDAPLEDVENRRFLPVRITERPADGAIAEARDQLWAEAVQSYKSGEAWWTTSPHLLDEIRDRGGDARAEDAYEVILMGRLDGRNETTLLEAAELLGLWVDDSRTLVNGSTIVERGARNHLDKSKEMRIAKALKAIGFIRGDKPKGSQPRVWSRPHSKPAE